jgi:hypothetical protein
MGTVPQLKAEGLVKALMFSRWVIRSARGSNNSLMKLNVINTSAPLASR